MKTTIPMGAVGNYGGPLGRTTSLGRYAGAFGAAKIPMGTWGTTVLKSGLRNNAVVERVQKILNFLGYTDNGGKKLGEDGDFGPKTGEAVYKFNTTAVETFGIPAEAEIAGIEAATVKAALVQANKTVTKTTAEMLNHALVKRGGGGVGSTVTQAIDDILGQVKPWGQQEDIPATTTTPAANGQQPPATSAAGPLIPGWVKWAGLGVGGLVVILLVMNLTKKKD